MDDVKLCWKTWETKSVDDEKKRSTGLVSTDILDRDREFVDQESLWAVMPRFVKQNGIVLFMHGMLAGVGSVVGWRKWEGRIDGRKALGTEVDVEYKTDHEIIVQGGFGAVVYDARNVWQLVKQKIMRTHSFGFLAKSEFDQGEKQTKLSVTDVLEVSVVTIPANPSAMFEVAKMLDGARRPDLEEPECKPEENAVPDVIVPDWSLVRASLDVDMARMRVRMLG